VDLAFVSETRLRDRNEGKRTTEKRNSSGSSCDTVDYMVGASNMEALKGNQYERYKLQHLAKRHERSIYDVILSLSISIPVLKTQLTSALCKGDWNEQKVPTSL
jgi:hypothetical protein